MKNLKNYFKKGSFNFGLIFFLLSFAFASYAGSIRDVNQSIEQVKTLPSSFQFGLIGDSRDGDNVYRKLLQAILGRRPNFIIHLGDMVSKPGEKEWQHFFDLSRSINLPFFPVVGNHDVGTTLMGEEIYRKQFILPKGKTYYSFLAGEWLFLVLDSEEGRGRILNNQLEWLKNILETSRSGFKWVFLHRPLFLPSDSFKKGRAMDRYPIERDQLHHLFVNHKVKAVFSGDDHRYARSEKDGVFYIITGGGGAPLHPFKETGGYFHYVWVSVEKGRATGEAVDLEGRIQDQFVIE
ncbi:MAG: metallophosphoesterase family protein [Thermodesulfobacteriota bacterium]